ncbi:MAG TPA: alpha-amylase family protein [Trebonia sp.]
MGSWAEHAVLWHVYPLGFTGAERAVLPPSEPLVHRLRQLTGWLDYAVELGCSGLLLGPIFASETHGYDTVDHFRIDSRLGDDDDFDALAAAASERGLRLILDGVFNHVGRRFPAFQAALHGGQGIPAARWFKRSGSDFEVFEGHSHLVELDHDEPAVLGYVTEVMRHWLDRGAGGWRLDAAYAVPPAFWAKALPAVRSDHPDAWFLGEIIHGDYAAYAAESGLDAVTQYEVWKAIWSSLNDQNFFELDHALGRHNVFLDDGAGLQTFIGNHDVTRIASALTDIRHLGHALAVLFCIGGVPSVYYGDEQAFRGVKEHREGGDDAIRPAFPTSPADLLPDGWPVYRLHQRLIGFRRRHPWLVWARTTAEILETSAMALRVTGSGDGEQVLLLLNTGESDYSFPVDAGGLSVAVTPSPDSPPADPLTVPPHSWTILA